MREVLFVIFLLVAGPAGIILWLLLSDAGRQAGAGFYLIFGIPYYYITLLVVTCLYWLVKIAFHKPLSPPPREWADPSIPFRPNWKTPLRPYARIVLAGIVISASSHYVVSLFLVDGLCDQLTQSRRPDSSITSSSLQVQPTWQNFRTETQFFRDITELFMQLDLQSIETRASRFLALPEDTGAVSLSLDTIPDQICDEGPRERVIGFRLHGHFCLQIEDIDDYGASLELVRSEEEEDFELNSTLSPLFGSARIRCERKSTGLRVTQTGASVAVADSVRCQTLADPVPYVPFAPGERCGVLSYPVRSYRTLEMQWLRDLWGLRPMTSEEKTAKAAAVSIYRMLPRPSDNGIASGAVSIDRQNRAETPSGDYRSRQQISPIYQKRSND